MRSIELFRFWVPPDAWHKRRHLTRYHMTVEEARARFGDAAVPDQLSREMRRVPSPGEPGYLGATSPPMPNGKP
jgi:hypothetical protein